MTTFPLALALRRTLCGLLVLVAAGISPARMVRAELVSTDEVLRAEAADVRAEWAAFLERDDVRAELVQLGVDPAEARARVASLTDIEVMSLRGRLDEMPAGANFAAAVGGVLLVTITVLVFTDLLGFTDVFPFITPLPRGRSSSES